MKVTETYRKPRAAGVYSCELCHKPVDFHRLVQYEHPGSDAPVFAHVIFMAPDGDSIRLCAECRVAAYKRLGQNMADAEYTIITHGKG